MADGGRARVIDLLALLSVSGLGRRRARRLIDLYSTPGRAIEQFPAALDAEMRSRTRAELERVEAAGIALMAYDSPGFPPHLGQIPDAPLILYYRGNPALLRGPAVAVVGSRQASEYGRRAAAELARDLAGVGVTVISGLARGIDAAAHRGALDSGGSGATIAVLGSGLDRIYPRENLRLAEEIAERGIIVTEYPLGSPPEKYHFPERNRIISGLSRGVVVVEAGRDSGSLITVDFALEQGREVFAVPGSLFSPLSQGPHNLIRQGARICAGAADVLEELGLVPSPRTEAATVRSGAEETGLDPEEKLMFETADWTVGQTADQMAEMTGLSPAIAVAALLTLEIKGLVKQLPGGRYIRV